MPTPPVERAHFARVVGAGVIGTTVEFYDFFLYGAAAATVFGPLFFPSKDGLLGVLLALVTYAVGFAARPLGGLVFGHFGDRFGRKRLLVISLVLMGGSSALIGLLPTYAQAGMLAPALLTGLRLVQGFALGGEFGGAVVLVAEHGPPRKRGFWTAWPQTGGPLGNLLATGALAVVAGHAGLTAAGWAWRIPFLASVLLVAVGLWVRLRVIESPLFAARAHASEPAVQTPVRRALRHPRALFSVFAARIGENATFYVFTIFLLVYAKHLALPPAAAPGAVALGSLVQVAAMLAGGALSDRFGRRPIAVLAALAAAAWSLIFFNLVASRQSPLLLLAVAVGLLLHGLLTGSQAAFYAELFDTSVRYSGVSLGYQAATVVAGAAAPLLGTQLLRATGSTTPVVIILIGALALTVAGMLLAPETRGTTMR